VFAVMLAPLTELIRQARRVTLRKRRDHAIEGHRKIIAAIEKRDPELAAWEMHLHLEQAKQDINPQLEAE